MIRQFCEVWKKEFGMKILTAEPYKDYIWCQCPECGGIAPYKYLKGKDKREQNNRPK